MANKIVGLPKLTPPEIIEWVNSVEKYHSVGLLRALPNNASINQIKEAFDADRNTLTGIGEDLKEAARWDAWSSYEERQTDQ